MSSLVDETLDALLALAPIRASLAREDHIAPGGGAPLGHRLPDLSKAGQATEARELQRLEASLERGGEAGDHSGMDWELLRDEVALRQGLTRTLDPVHRDPVYPLELVGLAVRLAPSTEARETRLAAIPALLEATSAALRSGVKRELQFGVPPRWCETALSMAPGVATLCRGAGPTGDVAATVVDSFASVVQEQILSAAKGEEACGEPLFRLIMKRMHGETRSTDELLRAAIGCVDEATQELAAAEQAEEADEEVCEDVDSVMPLLQEVRSIAGTVATIPKSDSVVIEATPAWARPVVPVAAYDPGRLLLSFPLRRALLTLALAHEGYPGHHLQAVRAAGAASRVRRALSRPAIHEGWAYEAEHLVGAVRAESTAERALRLRLQLLRALRWQLDIELHMEVRTPKDCERLLEDKIGLGPSHARAEVVRIGRRPGEGSAFELGRQVIRATRATYGQEDPRAFHDRVLDIGHVRLDQLEALLGGGGKEPS